LPEAHAISGVAYLQNGRLPNAVIVLKIDAFSKTAVCLIESGLA